MSKLQLKLFGELCFQRGAQRLTGFRYDKVRGLLAYLAVADETAHRRESLAHLLWPDSDVEQARSNLRYALFDLRRILGSESDRMLSVTRNTLSLHTSLLDAFDYREFFADHPGPGESTGALRVLEQQAALYCGPLLDGLVVDDAPAFARWLTDRREDALGRALALHERLADHYECSGQLDDALRHVRRQVTLAPWRESDYRRLMKLLVAKGQVSQALQAFEECRRYLMQELGVEPDLATLDLEKSLRESRAVASTRPAAHAVRQQRLPVTAMVCRLRLPAGADPDDAVEAFSAPRGLMTEIVVSRGGHCVPLHGGVIAAYFGYPVAHEFMPRRAVEAALDIMARLDAYPEVSASIGLHTGWMLADSQLASPDVAGDITRRAGELADDGDDRWVTVTPELGAALKGFFHLEPRDADRMRVMGKTWAVHRLEASDKLTPLVGRRDELAKLLGYWAQTREGNFPCVAVQGEPGIGKSRLLAALSDAVIQRGGVVRALRCDADEAHTPYSPLVDFFRRRYGDDPASDTAKRLAALEAALCRESEASCAHLPALAALLHLPSAFDGMLDIAERKRRIEASLLAILSSASHAHPCLLTFEDVHWIDPSTLGLLEQLIQRSLSTSGAPLMLVLTSRAAVTLADVQSLTLSRLSPVHALEMAHQVAGAVPLATDSLSDIVERTDGIPLFIEQMMRSGADGRATDIPLTLRDLLAARLATLGDALHLAQSAAVIGREFDALMLAHLSESPRAAVDQGLGHLRRSGLIVDKGEGRFSFSHALITDAAYLSLPAPKRRALHLRLARLFESETPSWAADHPEVVARHLDLAAHQDASAAWLKAGGFMAGQSAFAEALAHFESGLAALDRVFEDSRRADLEFRLRIGVGNTLMALKGYGSEESHASFLKAQALSSRLSNDADLFQLMWGLWLGGRSATGESPPLEFLEKLAQVAEGSNDPAVQLQLHYAHGNNYFWVGKQHLARQHFDAAYALIPRVNGAVLAAQYGEDGCVTTRALLAWVLWIQGDPAAAEAMSAEAIAAGRTLGHAHTLGFAMTCGALLYRFLGMPEKVAEICLELAALSEANGMLLWQAAAAAMLGWARATGGDEEGLALIRMGLAGAQQAMLIVETTFLAFLAESLCRLGRPEEALPVVEESIAKALLREDVYYLSEFLRLKGEILLSTAGDETTAEASFREGLSLARQQGALALELRCAMSLASLLSSQGRTDIALEILTPRCAAFDHMAAYPDIAAARHLLANISNQ